MGPANIQDNHLQIPTSYVGGGGRQTGGFHTGVGVMGGPLHLDGGIGGFAGEESKLLFYLFFFLLP